MSKPKKTHIYVICVLCCIFVAIIFAIPFVFLHKINTNNSIETYDATELATQDNTKNAVATDDINAMDTTISESNADTIDTDTTTTLSADKIVYRGNVTIATTDYDTAYTELRNLLNNYDAILSDEKYQIYDHTRSNTIEVRIPSEHFTDLMTNLSDIGHITDSSTSAENITKTYLDTQARVTAYQNEVDRLQELLNQATNVSDITEIYTELSNVEYQLESAKSQLLNMDIDVKYSYITIRLEDTHKYSDTGVLQEDDTFWSDAAYFWSNVAYLLGEFLIDVIGNIFIPIIYAIPYGIVIALITIVIRFIRKKHKTREKHTDH